MKSIRYYAYAPNAAGDRIELLLVLRVQRDAGGSRFVSQDATGRTWRNTDAGARAAAHRCAVLNDGLLER